ncbi:MAG: AI-2E family transporter [Proteobacteria bacterium]|nr:AI-2E family transporter [Burkholderiales bacterium]
MSFGEGTPEARRARVNQHLFWLAFAALTGYLLYLLGPVLAPFLCALTLAYIFEGVVSALARRGLSRTWAAVLVLLLIATLAITLVLVLVPLLQQQLLRLTERLPRLFEWARMTLTPLAQAYFGIELEFEALKALMLKQSPSPQTIAAWLVPSLATGGLAVVGFFVNLVLVPVVLFYFLRDWKHIVDEIEYLVPRDQHATVSKLAREIDAVLGEFLRGQLSVMAIMAAFYTIALWGVGLDYSVAIGLLTGMVVFIPYVGAVFGIALGTVVALIQFQEMGPVFWVWAVFAVGQLVEGYVVVPRLVGDRIGLHPVLVIFSLLAFGQLFGFVGVLLALPASAALLVWLRHLRGRYLASALYRA